MSSFKTNSQGALVLAGASEFSDSDYISLAPSTSYFVGDVMPAALDTFQSKTTDAPSNIAAGGSPLDGAVGGSPFDATVIGGIASSGSNDVNALIYGTKWSGAITYSFPTLFATYGAYSHTVGTFAQVSLTQRDAIRKILGGNNQTGVGSFNSFDKVANISISETSGFNDPSDIMVGQATNFDGSVLGTARVADFPRLDQRSDSGDVWFGTNYDFTNPIKGTYYWHAHIHELGHALGLKHGHDASHGQFGVALSSNFDTMEYSVMTYRSYVGGSTSGGYTNETYGYAQTLMAMDILALQNLYGANYTTNSSGTVYSWSPTTGEMYINGAGQGAPGTGLGGSSNRIFLTIWDGGGSDWYNMSNYTGAVSIDLRPGLYSTTSTAQLANLGSGHMARGNVFNAFLFNGDARGYIENAIGGSADDTIIGNETANLLYGLGGNDTIFAFGGNDTIAGGAGNDKMWGVDGDDYILGEDGDDFFSGGTGNDVLVGGAGIDAMYGEDGVDALFGGAGADLYIGGAGTDYFYLNDDLASNVLDTIFDFNAGGAPDYIVLPGANYTTFYDYGGSAWAATWNGTAYHYTAVFGTTAAILQAQTVYV